MKTYPPEELRTLMQQDRIDEGPIVLENTDGEKFQAFWLDLWVGALIVPEISTTQAVNIYQLAGKGMTARPPWRTATSSNPRCGMPS